MVLRTLGGFAAAMALVTISACSSSSLSSVAHAPSQAIESVMHRSPFEMLPSGLERVCPLTAKPLQMRCFAYVRPAIQNPGASVQPDQGFYDPAQLISAYKLPSSYKGVGQTVAVVDAYDDPNAEADLGVYRSTYGLKPCTTANGCFKKLNQMGQTSPLPTPDSSWAGEISLDIEMVSAICPHCHITLIEANTSGIGDLGFAVNEASQGLGYHIVSDSWGSGEFNGETGWDGYFNHPGVIETFGSGDGAYAAGVQYPSASQYVTSVGGTTLTEATNTRGWTEKVWANLPGQGSGSGCSTYESKPSWQTDSGCSMRMTADVSAVADSVAIYDSYDSGCTPPNCWFSSFGTSDATPIIASVYALAGNASTFTGAEAPYENVGKGYLFDITMGNTGTCTPAYFCKAEKGYDGPTGLGTPHGVKAF